MIHPAQDGSARPLNWFGYSLETIAAMYETDAAVNESWDRIGSIEYSDAACRAEWLQLDLDKPYRTKEHRA